MGDDLTTLLIDRERWLSGPLWQHHGATALVQKPLTSGLVDDEACRLTELGERRGRPLTSDELSG